MVRSLLPPSSPARAVMVLAWNPRWRRTFRPALPIAFTALFENAATSKSRSSVRSIAYGSLSTLGRFTTVNVPVGPTR